VITYCNKIEDRNYLHHESSIILSPKLGHPDYAAVAQFATRATNTERKAGYTVLVVNDIPDQLEMIGHLLRKSGYEVVTALNGREGLDVAQAERPDLVISDVSMPLMDGIEMCRSIRTHPELNTIPILLVSAVRTDNHNAVEGLKAGANDYLEAPYDPMHLVIKVAQLIERRRAYESLQESETKYRELVENINDVIFAVDESGLLSYVSPAIESVAGYRPSEVLGRSFTEFIFAEDLPTVLNNFRDVLAQKIEPLEYRIQTKAGKTVWVRTSSRPNIVDGHIAGLRGMMTDITDRKRAEEALKASEEELRTLLGAMTDVILVLGADGRYLKIAPTDPSYLYKPRADLVGKTLHEVFPKEKADFFLAHIRQALTEERMHRVEYKLRIDKTDFCFEGCVSPLSRDSVVWIGRDITERNRSEEKLRESERLYHTTFNNAPVGIAHTDLNGRWLHVNQRLCDILGYSREELLECNFQDVTYPEDVAADDLARQQFLAGEIQRYSREKRYVRRDGLVVWVEVIVTLQRSPAGEPKFFITVVQDVTERKRLEQQFLQSQKMEAVGQLAGGIAHDFNNLLTAINGYSELTLARLAPDDRLRHNLEEIRKAGNRAASLTRQLLAFSRKQMLQPKVLDLNLVVSDLEKMLRRLIGENIELRTVLDRDLGSVKADPGQVEQVVMNLVVNARDAMPHGGKVTIETANVYLDEEYVKHHVAVRSGAYVMLAINDNGCGMTAETKARIFEPFFTTKELGKGTGLGLSTVYGIVKQSGGSIWAYSEVGKGTTFRMYLPRVSEDAQEYKRRTELERASRGTETILLVEDDETVRKLTHEVLMNYGYEVLDAAHGDAALLVCERYPKTIHLLLTDVVMPRMSGHEVANRLAPLRPEMKVLFMSGYTDDAIVHHRVLDADTPFIQKPFAPDALAQKIRDVLDGHGRP